ncbi:MAG: hypothetical protein KAV68_04670 [Dehalococcoidales bacterium]|nr:hypothetical protein [Dehalococcoidales bacterium]
MVEERERERLAQEELVRKRIDEKGNKWRKVYFGGGAHFRNWLKQCRELGEVEVEEIDSTGFKCFEEAGEKLYRIWMKEEDEGKQK